MESHHENQNAGSRRSVVCVLKKGSKSIEKIIGIASDSDASGSSRSSRTSQYRRRSAVKS